MRGRLIVVGVEAIGEPTQLLNPEKPVEGNLSALCQKSPCLGGLGLEKLAAAPTYQRISVKQVGADLWESYVRKN